MLPFENRRNRVSKRSIPWPNKKDNPFRKGVYSPTQVDLDWLELYRSPKDLIISEGFKEGADKIVDNLKNGKNFGHPDKFFFPVAYLYRHAFELCLKCIIRNGIDCGIIKENKKVEDMLKGHNLHILWNKTRYVLEVRWPKGDKKTLTNAERVILKFHKLFPSGQECRYAEDVEGNPHLENAPKLVDLVNLKTVASNLYNFLDGCILGLSKPDYQGNY
jgi:hypothetical protein